MMPAPLPRAVKQCERCGRDFQRQASGLSTAAFARRRFCSTLCRNRARIKNERPISMPQLAVLAIYAAIQDEHGIPVARHVAQRYYALRGMPVPLRPDGYPDTGNMASIFRNLAKRGLLETRPGMRQGIRAGAFRLTPAGRAVVEENRSSLVGIATEPARGTRYAPAQQEGARFLQLSEVAAEARVSLSTVRHWVRTGTLPSVKLGKHRRVARDAFEAMIAKASRRGAN